MLVRHSAVWPGYSGRSVNNTPPLERRAAFSDLLFSRIVQVGRRRRAELAVLASAAFRMPIHMNRVLLRPFNACSPRRSIMAVAILSRCHLLVGSFTCLVAGSVMVAFGLVALGEGNMRFAETLECRNVGLRPLASSWCCWASAAPWGPGVAEG